jgi:site-specific recombinase
LVEVKWFSQFPSRLFARILQALTPSGNPQATGALRRAFADGFRMLAIRVEAQGLSEKLRARSRRPSSIRESPFYHLAAVSNVLVVSLAAYALDAGWRLVTGHPILDLYDAEHVYETLSPLDSGTVMFAALTGVILWLSSLAGGWIENWTVYHRLPEAIAEHGWGTRVFGAARLRRWADSLSRNVAGWGTNVSLGMMLGMTPAIGLFFGIPLDVRHVTLSSGTLALASASLDADWYREGWFLRATAGVSVMFVLNLGVSFCLSLVTALRAYGFPRSDMLELLRRLARRFMRSPRDFFLPPREDTPPAGVPAVERDH